jgi:hypothetical protein
MWLTCCAISAEMSESELLTRVTVVTFWRPSNHLHWWIFCGSIGPHSQGLPSFGRPCKGAGSFSKPYLRTRDPNLRSAAFSQRVSQILMEIVARTKKALLRDQIFRHSEGNCGKLGGNGYIKIPHCLVCCAAGVPWCLSPCRNPKSHTRPARSPARKSQPANNSKSTCDRPALSAIGAQQIVLQLIASLELID